MGNVNEGLENKSDSRNNDNNDDNKEEVEPAPCREPEAREDTAHGQRIAMKDCESTAGLLGIEATAIDP